PGTYNHSVPYLRVPQGTALGIPRRNTAQSHAMIYRHVVTDIGGFTDDHAHTVINKQVFANTGAGMDFNPRQPAGGLGNEAGQQLPILLPEPMGQTVGQNGMKARIAEHDLEP